MYCQSCGSAIGETDTFCGSCGKQVYDDRNALDHSNSVYAPDYEPAPHHFNQIVSTDHPNKKKKKLIILISCLAILALSVTGLILIFTNSGSSQSTPEATIQKFYDSFFKSQSTTAYVDTMYRANFPDSNRTEWINHYSDEFTKSSQSYEKLVSKYGTDYDFSLEILSCEYDESFYHQVKHPEDNQQQYYRDTYEQYYRDFYLSHDFSRVTDVRLVKAAITLSGNNNTDTKTEDFKMLKADDKWYILDFDTDHRVPSWILYN